MNDLDWNDLRLFCHVSREGTLSGAAVKTGISAPTLGRAMRALGDSDPDLMRAGPVIPEIAETLWLIAHADERHRTEVRAMIDRLRAFFRERDGLLSGALGS